MTVLDRGFRSLRTLARPFYNRAVRPYIPSGYGVLNGVTVRNRARTDMKLRDPEFKAEFLSLIEDAVEPGETVVEIGGGWGVTTTHLARNVHPGGRVITYEASSIQSERIRETLDINYAPADVLIRTAVVETGVDVLGDGAYGPSIPAAGLPECDTLIMDCEGAETYILAALSAYPRKIVVETHAGHGAPAAGVRQLLLEAGYEIVDSETLMGSGCPVLFADREPDTSEDSEGDS